MPGDRKIAPCWVEGKAGDGSTSVLPTLIVITVYYFSNLSSKLGEKQVDVRLQIGSLRPARKRRSTDFRSTFPQITRDKSMKLAIT